MARKQIDRRSEEKPAKQHPKGPEMTKPDAFRRTAESGEVHKGLGKAEEAPIERQMPKQGTGREDKDFFERDRSDRESGRPIQLDEDDETEPALGGERGRERFRHGEQRQR